MIKFFRNIRRNLIDKSSFKKYLFYAIGEILLVVIGILIALQINTYNEYLSNRQTEKLMLTKISTSIERDIKSLDSLINHIRYCNRMLQPLIEYTPGSIPDSILNIGCALGEYKFRPLSAAFVSYKSSGQLSLIEDSELEISIIELYDYHYPKVLEEEYNLFDYVLLIRKKLDEVEGYNYVPYSESRYYPVLNKDGMKEFLMNSKFRNMIAHVNSNMLYLSLEYRDALRNARLVLTRIQDNRN